MTEPASKKPRYPLLPTEAVVKTLSPYSRRYSLSSTELKGLGYHPKRAPKNLKLVVGYWKGGPQERASVRTLLSVGFLVELSPLEGPDYEGVRCKVESVERVQIKRTYQRGGGRAVASVEPKPVLNDLEGRALQQELKEVIEAEL